MPTTREQVARTLAMFDPAALRLILEASEIPVKEGASAPALSVQVADAIWWNYCSPLGYMADRTSLEEIVRHLVYKLRAQKPLQRFDASGDVWEQIRALTAALVREPPADGITVDALDGPTRARLSASWAEPLGWGTSASGSFGARWVSGKALTWFRGPVGRWLPLVPGIGRWASTVRNGVGAVYAVSGPLGIALTVLSLNSALSTNYRRLVPLVLGVGGLAPDRVGEAVEVP